jgi:hypothetical protein
MTASIFFLGETKNTSNAFAASQAGSSRQAAPAKDGAAAAPAEAGPWTPVCRYVGKVAAEAPVQEDGLKQQFCLASTSDLRVSTLIATIPNPELTHLSLSFDRYVESITWALDDGDLDKESYSFDSYWFPWRTDLKEETDPEKRTAAEREREKRSDTPGILLFRRNLQRPDANYPHPERDLLLVFLVGETPTSGINRAAFQKAWTYATKLAYRELPICGKAKSNSRSCIGIVGPSFTGSLPSLKLVLERANTTGYESFVISGAVTGEDPSTTNLPDNTHFCTTIETDDNRWAVLRQVLANLSKWSFWDSDGELLKHFAILGEDETEYGNLQRVVGGKDLLALRFPRGIARVRNSSDNLPGLVTPSADASYPELPLVLRDTGQDTLPGFSQQQTPVSQEAVLFELVATLRREGIRYLGIVATDPLDALFLTRALHSLAPNIRIVLFSADLLFARASHTWGLSGVLAVTSYPLISRNQFYEGVVYPRRTQFANDAAEGEYNACRRMLLRAPENSNTQPCSAANQIPKGERTKQDYLLDYAPPFAVPNHVHKPSVWLTILGRNEWWPVAAATVDTESRLLEGPSPASHDTEHFSVEMSPRPWSLFFWLTWLACTTHVVLVFGLNRGHGRSVRWWKYSSLRRLAWRYKPDLERRRRITLAGASFTVALAYCALAVAVWTSGVKGSGYLQLALAVGMGAAAIGQGLWTISGIRESRYKFFWLAAAAVIATAQIAGTCYAALSDSTGRAREFAGYRAVHIESGASPVLPVIVLLMTIYLFCWLRLSRLRISEERHAQPPQGDDAKAFPDLYIPDKAVQPLGFVQWMAVLAAVLGWWAFFHPLKALATIEGTFYDLLLSGLSSVVILMFAMVLVRFLVTWRALRKLLQDLERHPLRYAFSRLPKSFSWTTVWAGDPRPPLIMPARSLDALRMVPDEKVQKQVKAIEAEFQALKKQDRSFDKVPDHVSKLNDALNAAFGLLSSSREEAWHEGVSDSIESREKKDEAPSEWKRDPIPIAAEEFLAVRFVTFITYTLRIMRGFLEFIMYGFILLVLALAVYPFEGRLYIEVAILFIFVVSGAMVATVFAQMDRDPLLSRLSETKPNQLGINFVIRLASFGALPLLTLLASLVPDVGRFLQSWLQPALQSLK